MEHVFLMFAAISFFTLCLCKTVAYFIRDSDGPLDWVEQAIRDKKRNRRSFRFKYKLSTSYQVVRVGEQITATVTTLDPSEESASSYTWSMPTGGSFTTDGNKAFLDTSGMAIGPHSICVLIQKDGYYTIAESNYWLRESLFNETPVL